jgi:hypothetical protein
MTEQNQTPDTAADDTEGHVHFRMSEVDDASGHAFYTDDEDGTEGRPMHKDDVQGHHRMSSRGRDDDADDAEGHHFRRDDQDDADDTKAHHFRRDDQDDADDTEGHHFRR